MPTYSKPDSLGRIIAELQWQRRAAGVAAAAGSALVPEIEAFTATAGASTTYTLTFAPLLDSETVFVNGAELRQGIDYTRAGAVLTLVDTLTTADFIDVHYCRSGDAVPAGLVTTPEAVVGTFVETFDRSPFGNPLDGDNGWVTAGDWTFQDGGGGAGRAFLRVTGGANAVGHVTCVHDDFQAFATRHRIFGDFAQSGTINMGPAGLVWGYKDASNYWFTEWEENNGANAWDLTLRVGRVQAGVKTYLGQSPELFTLGVNHTADHNFVTGVLTVTKEPGYNHTQAGGYVQTYTGQTDTITDGSFGFHAPANGHTGVSSPRHYCQHIDATTYP